MTGRKSLLCMFPSGHFPLPLRPPLCWFERETPSMGSGIWTDGSPSVAHFGRLRWYSLAGDIYVTGDRL